MHIIMAGLLLFICFFTNAQSPAKKTTKPTPLPPTAEKKPKDLSYLVPPLTLKTGTASFTPKHFYLAGFEDSTGTDSIGYALLPGDFKKQPVITLGDKRTVLNNFFSLLIKNDSSLYPVIIRIRKFEVTEKQLSKADVDANIEIEVEAFCRVENELVPVDGFALGSSGEVYVGSKRKYDSLIRMNLERIPVLIDKRMDKFSAVMKEIKEKDEVPLSVKVETELLRYEDYPEEGDTLVIDNKRYLQWSDFRGTPIDDEGCYLKIGLGLLQHEEKIDNGILKIKLRLAPVVVRSRSWAGSEVRSGRFLNHQHYTAVLAYLYTLKFKKEIDNMSFTVEKAGWDEILVVYNKVMDEFNTESQKYYYETKAGLKAKEQSRWEDKIETELKKF